MKRANAFPLYRSVLGLLLLVHPLLAQGPLAPPGPPAPMMKTLQQMEPRALIENAGYVITAPGSYYLTTNLNGGGTLNGIVVQASGVTIDLRGFSIVNCQAGISAAAGVRTVAVHNGSVRDCAGAGVDLFPVEQCRLENVIVSKNAGDGASVGAASVVTLCTAAGNGGRGLVLGHGGTVFRCVAQTNGNSGIVIAANCQATENTCTANGSGAGQAGLLTTGDGNRVEGNSANQNNGHGFKINGTGNLVIRNNACGNTVSDYSISAGNNYGQILVSPGAAFVNSNPWANFGCATPPGGCQTDAACDDGNPCTTDTCNLANGACSHTPIPGCGGAVCGNGVMEAGETCDDGNVVNGDGCSATCQAEPCASAADCNDNNSCTSDTCQYGYCVFSPLPNGTPCDDGNACTVSEACQNTACVGTPKSCDDGDACTTDSCNPAIGCSNTPIPGCGGAVCGNGIVEAGETCDDGNVANGDGCSSSCTVQTGWICTGTPSVCTTVCGDGILVGAEGCDDGNTVSGDGCSATCQPEGCVNGSVQACYTGPAGTAGVGACQAGTQTCGGGVWGACVGEVTPGAEVCDSVDNDCNGVVDEGVSGGACSTGLPGVCAAGTTHCQSGTLVCLGNVAPSAEVCDGLDNNCDGSVDEGDPGGGAACSTGQSGICAAGTAHCQGGALTCVRNQNPTAEVCDGLDNDCDGVVDNGVKLTFYRDLDSDGYGWNPIQACSQPAGYVTNPGDCNDNNAAIHPGADEVCDGLDNNCDTVVDNGASCDDGNACTTDVCQGASGCTHPPAPNGTACPGGVCDGAGVCQSAALANGSACSASGQCSSGFCVDGFCCDSACTGLCQACTMVKTGSGANGTCGYIVANTDPDNECAGAQVCDGAGVCQ